MQKLDSKIKLSSNTTSAQIEEGLAQLVRSSQQESGGTGKVSGRWEIIDSGMGLERDFRFKTFKKGWEFMNAIAAECKEHKHHPEWSNVYNRVFIRWTTHSPPGLSEKDVIMARLCDKQAEKHGEIVSEEAVGAKGHEDLGRQLAGRVAAGAGDCCIPKKKGDGG